MENPACMMGGSAKRITEGMMGGEMLGGQKIVIGLNDRDLEP